MRRKRAIQTVNLSLMILYSNKLSKLSDPLIIRWPSIIGGTFTQTDAKIQIQGLKHNTKSTVSTKLPKR